MDEQTREQLKKIITDSWDKNVDIDMTSSYGETEGTDEAAGIALDGILAKLAELGMLREPPTFSVSVVTEIPAYCPKCERQWSYWSGRDDPRMICPGCGFALREDAS